MVGIVRTVGIVKGGVEKISGAVVAIAVADVVGNVAPGARVIYGNGCGVNVQYPFIFRTRHSFKYSSLKYMLPYKCHYLLLSHNTEPILYEFTANTTSTVHKLK